MYRHFGTLVLIVFSTLLLGCGSLLSGVKVNSTKTVTKAPGNVIVYLTVEDSGKPVDSLTASNFDIYENDVLLERSSLHLELLPRDTAASGHTVLLLDLSGEISQKDVTRIARGATHFVEKVSTTQPVTVLVFDGSDRPRLVARFPKVDAPEERGLPDLTPFVTGDDSRNLNGAIMSAIKTLDRELKASSKPVKRGTLVTLAGGPDLAERQSDDALYDALGASPYEFYALHPKGAKIPTLGGFGTDGSFEYETMDTLPLRLLDLGLVVRKAWQQHYVLSYCSPARGGTRDVMVRVNFTSERGDPRSGSTRTGFDASDFGPGCGPLRPVLQAKKDAEERERQAQQQAEAEAAEERRRAEEAAQAKKQAEEASRRARAAKAAAQRSIEGVPVEEPEEEPAETEETPPGPLDEDEVVAPPSSGGYE